MRAQHDQGVPQGRVAEDGQPGSPAHGRPTHQGHEAHGSHQGHGSHGWMMIACCIPMLVIAVILVTAGIVSPAFLIVAVGCTLMMALMMRGMGHGGDGRR